MDCPHRNGAVLRLIPAGAYGGYDDEYERVPCGCKPPKAEERTVPEQNKPGVFCFPAGVCIWASECYEEEFGK